MIPLDPDKPLRVTAEDDGVVYEMRILTEDLEPEYNAICALYEDGNEVQNAKYAEGLINFFIVGWSGNNCPPFPKNGKPARYFVNSVMKVRIVNFILDNIDKLKGISTDDIKN